MKKITAKLKSNKGESITEVLIASLVIAFGAILLVSMVIAARNIIVKSEKAYNTYLNERNVIEAAEIDNDSGSGVNSHAYHYQQTDGSKPDNSPADDAALSFDNGTSDGMKLVVSAESGSAVTLTKPLELGARQSSGSGTAATDTLIFNVIKKDGKTEFVSYKP